MTLLEESRRNAAWEQNGKSLLGVGQVHESTRNKAKLEKMTSN